MTVRYGLLVGVLLAGAVVTPAPANPDSHPSPGFAQADRRRIEATPAGAAMRVLMTSPVGQGERLAAFARGKGASTTTVSARAGLVIADVPAGKALELAGTPFVTAIALDREVRRRPDRPVRAAAVRRQSVPIEPPGPVNPYLPVGDIGAPQFIAGHPGFDGRGVVIAVIDSGVSWTAPGLATTSTGGRKVTRSYSFNPDDQVRTDRDVTVHDGQFGVDGDTYTLPPDLAANRVRFGVYQENLADVNRDADLADTFGVVVVNPPTGPARVLVDTDQDQSFAGERPLGDWNATADTAVFGQDRPDTPHVEEEKDFGVNICQPHGTGPCSAPAGEPGDLVDLVLDEAHGTHVASIAAGHDFRLAGGRFDGVAPGAEVWSYRVLGGDDTAWTSEILNAVLRAAQDGADVLNMSFGLPTPLGPPNDPVSTLMDNLAAVYGVSYAVANGNLGPGLQVEGGSPGTARTAVTVGGSVSPDTFSTDFRHPGIDGERLIYFSSHGPEMDGHWSPDVVAPAAALAALPRWADEHYSDPSMIPRTDLPPGYGAFAGTSMAAPQLAGAMAILRSAAHATGVSVTPHSLKRALELGARPLSGAVAYGPEEIGHGLVQIDRAWEWLRRLGTTDRDVDTRTASDALGTGQGIYQRGSVRNRERVTAYSGDPAGRTYRLRASVPWIRPDRGSIRLPGATPGRSGSTAFDVVIDSSVRAQPGVHSGVVVLDDPSTVDPADHEMLVTIVTPLEFDLTAGDRIELVGRGSDGVLAEAYRQVFVTVPAGAKALVVQSSRPPQDPTAVWFEVYGPGGYVDWLSEKRTPKPGQTEVSSFTAPKAGVWEIDLYANEIDRFGAAVEARHPFDVTVSVVR